MFRHQHRRRAAFGAGEFAFSAHGPERHRHRSARRIFDQGDLRFVILRLIAERPRHGYELIKDIEDKVGGAYSPSPGIVYPTLTLLEELGYVTVEAAAGGKKLYRVTPEGAEALAERKDAVDAIFQRMEEVLARFERPSPHIGRAMRNLAAAIGVRMRSGPVSADQLDTIVGAIDAAARTAEKA
jgi:DNA-binding PadR family transcriptional regulator